ncbi:MAG: hypothetical protein V5A38_13860 [Halolamina sp.]|uniref:hypothetical protein n=1 Tax=Halolamina sp. TaxID=1940283 RepID=UPI002FC2BE3F
MVAHERVSSLESNNQGERVLGASQSGRHSQQAGPSDGATWEATNSSTGNTRLAAE